MLRTLVGYAILAVVGYFALKLVFALLGFAFSLLWMLLWLAAIGFIFYLGLKLINPDAARRVKDAIGGRRTAA